MEKVYYYKKPVDISKSDIRNHYINIFKKGKFVEGRRYKNVSGAAMMDIAKDIRRQGFTTEW